MILYLAMTKKIISHTQQTLLKEKDQILERLTMLAPTEQEHAHNSQEQKNQIDYGQKTDENAAEFAEYADQVSLAESLRKRLDEIELALEAFSKGKYGICEVCKKPIEEARLKALPGATTCLVCKK